MTDLSEYGSRYQFGRTRWSMVFDAGKTRGDAAAAARNELLVHYHDAVYRYLVARLRDQNAAGELFSQFAERVLELHPFLQRANPEKGRFRDYLKAILSRMIVDRYRQQSRQPGALPEGVEPAQPEEDASADADAEFQKVWAEELMNQAWKALERVEATKGKPYYSLLLYKAQNPQVRSEGMAQHFSAKLQKPYGAENIRKLLQRGHELLNDLLIEEVERSLREDPSQTVDANRIEEEMLDLQLLDKPRRDALDRYRQRGKMQ
jgi:RNA polymerase sigma-70 factor (ECF subfamily)